jgi:exopolyphosphatase / guanosine-5'-triphosphate,3'-diphosphate pyrophosphatase
MHPGRVDVIGAGSLVLRVVMDAFALDDVVVSEHDILDGIALGLAGR